MDFARKIQAMQNEIDRLTVEVVRLAFRITELETATKCRHCKEPIDRSEPFCKICGCPHDFVLNHGPDTVEITQKMRDDLKKENPKSDPNDETKTIKIGGN